MSMHAEPGMATERDALPEVDPYERDREDLVRLRCEAEFHRGQGRPGVAAEIDGTRGFLVRWLRRHGQEVADG